MYTFCTVQEGNMTIIEITITFETCAHDKEVFWRVSVLYFLCFKTQHVKQNIILAFICTGTYSSTTI
jgi:hypothetical protein